MELNFEKYASNGNQFLRELEIELGYQKESQKVERILKSVLHTLRDHLTLEESLQFLAHLPIFLKAVYVDGWTAQGTKKIRHINDFLVEVLEKDGLTAVDDFGDGQETLAITITVFLLLRKYVSEEEMDDIFAILPKEIKPLIKQSLVA